MLRDEYRGLPTKTKKQNTQVTQLKPFAWLISTQFPFVQIVVATVTLELIATTSPQSTYDFVCPSIKTTNLPLDK